MTTLGEVEPGMHVRLSGRLYMVIRHGPMGTIVQAPAKRRSFEAKDWREDEAKRVSFVAKGKTTVMASGAEVEVVG